MVHELWVVVVEVWASKNHCVKDKSCNACDSDENWRIRCYYFFCVINSQVKFRVIICRRRLPKRLNVHFSLCLWPSRYGIFLGNREPELSTYTMIHRGECKKKHEYTRMTRSIPNINNFYVFTNYVITKLFVFIVILFPNKSKFISNVQYFMRVRIKVLYINGTIGTDPRRSQAVHPRLRGPRKPKTCVSA